jgi:hypothetical protein
LPGQDDRSSGSRTLPPAELNPLLNPLLAENMGRWAEVYFTSPPEKREQAVLELIRELEAQRSRHEETPNRASASTSGQTPVRAAVHTRCEACGGENPASNKYCGMCGAGLGEARANSIFGEPDSRRAVEEAEHDYDRIEAPLQKPRPARQETQYDEENRNDPYAGSREFSPPANGNGLSLFQASAPTEDESIDWSEQEPSSPYRYYIGAVLAIVILVLGYMAWRGTQDSQNSHAASAPPPPAANDTVPTPAPSQAPARAAAEPSAQSPVPAPASNGSANTSPPREVPKNLAAPATDTVVPSPTRAAEPSTPAARATQPSAGNGGEELAMAEHYLNAGAGQRRDTAEAAKWLWKSVAKHNGQATVLLSDLYLKGDGVPKNCDQARVLLDSAARKGVAGAGERLRNLPAFGCE